MLVVDAKDLTKSFGAFQAVRSISFEVHPGQCYGFLGPNGAGKSSTMRMIYCFSPVTSGSLKVLGMEVGSDPRKIKSKLGVVSQEDNLDPDLSVLGNLLLYASFFEMPRKKAQERAWDLLHYLQLGDFSDSKIDEISGGMRRRLMIARALINNPEVLVLDEPTTGLDPQARHLIWSKLRELKKAGVTMLLTTHYMEEGERLCDRLAIIDHGKILAEGSPKELILKHIGEEVLEVHGEIDVLDKICQDLTARQVSFERSQYHLFIVLHTRVKAQLDQMDIFGDKTLEKLYRTASLEDVFLKLAGRELRD